MKNLLVTCSLQYHSIVLYRFPIILTKLLTLKNSKHDFKKSIFLPFSLSIFIFDFYDKLDLDDYFKSSGIGSLT